MLNFKSGKEKRLRMKNILAVFFFLSIILIPLIPFAQCDIGVTRIPLNPNNGSFTDPARGSMNSVANQMKNNAQCKIVITSYCSNGNNGIRVMNYLISRGIGNDRFIFRNNGGNACNIIDLSSENAARPVLKRLTLDDFKRRTNVAPRR